VIIVAGVGVGDALSPGGILEVVDTLLLAAPRPEEAVDTDTIVVRLLPLQPRVS
jgi:hypothetical protein